MKIETINKIIILLKLLLHDFINTEGHLSLVLYEIIIYYNLRKNMCIYKLSYLIAFFITTKIYFFSYIYKRTLFSYLFYCKFGIHLKTKKL